MNISNNIEKAKFFENGIMALTEKGIFFLVKDIKKHELTEFFRMKEILGFSNNIKFLIIPSSNSKSRKIELLVSNEKGSGVIHIVQNIGNEFSRIN